MAHEDDDGPVPWRILDRHRDISQTIFGIRSRVGRLEYVTSLLATEQDEGIRCDLHGWVASLQLEAGNAEEAKSAALARVEEFPDSLSLGSAGFIHAMAGDAAGALKYFSEAYRMAVADDALVTDVVVRATSTLAVSGTAAELDRFLVLVIETGVVRGDPDCVMEWDWIEDALKAEASAALIDRLKVLFGV